MSCIELNDQLNWCCLFFFRYTDMLYEEKKEALMSSLRRCPVALTTDMWTSTATHPYMVVTAHYISDQWQLWSNVLSTRATPDCYTGANMRSISTVARRSLALLSSLLSWQTMLPTWCLRQRGQRLLMCPALRTLSSWELPRGWRRLGLPGPLQLAADWWGTSAILLCPPRHWCWIKVWPCTLWYLMTRSRSPLTGRNWTSKMETGWQ